MVERKDSRVSRASAQARAPGSPRVQRIWLGLMALGGLGFGLIAERRPFGGDVFAHPLVVFFIVAGVTLLGLRVALQRPVPEVISERSLLLGCFAGAVAFLLGNWFGVHVLRVR